MTNRSGSKFHTTSVLICPDCNETVRVGFGGKKNLAIHHTSKACQRKQGNKSKGPKRAPERPPKPNQPNHDLHAFFKPYVPLIPPIVVAPLPIHTDETSFSGLSNNLQYDLETCLETLDLEMYTRMHMHKETSKKMSEEIQVKMGVPLRVPPPVDARKSQGKIPCQKGIELLNKLEAAVSQIPDNIPLATPAHQLSIFSANPCYCIASLEQGPDKGPEVDFEDDWMVLNSMLRLHLDGESQRCKRTQRKC